MKTFYSTVIVFSMFLSFAIPAYADHTTEHTISQLQDKIRELQAQIQSLTKSSSSCQLTRSLYRGLSDEQAGGEISTLQRFLRDWQGADLQGLGIFGPKTEAAVKKFQTSYGISQTGYVGPITRAKINELCASSTSQASVKILSPNGGETFTQSDSRTNRYEIKWEAKNIPPKSCISIQLYKNGQFFVDIISDYAFHGMCQLGGSLGEYPTGTFSWGLPTESPYPTSNDYKVKITVHGSQDYSDISDAPFSVVHTQ